MSERGRTVATMSSITREVFSCTTLRITPTPYSVITM